MNDDDYNPYLPDGPGSRLADGPGLADFLPDTSSGYKATAGSRLATPGGPADAGAVEEALKASMTPKFRSISSIWA